MIKKRQHSGSDGDESAKKPKEGTPNSSVSSENRKQDQDKVMQDQDMQVAGQDHDVQVHSNKQDTQKAKLSMNGRGSHLDPGMFTNTEAYSPLTPAKAKSIPDLSVLVNSPVFHNKARSTQ